MQHDINEVAKKSADFIKNYFGITSCDIGLITGTGLTEFATALNGKTLDYDKIPGLPSGKEGTVVYTEIADKEVLFFTERFHYYQGFTMEEVTYPVRIMKEFSIKTLIMVNSAATLTENMEPGDIMIIKDHINMMGTNPLIGTHNQSHSKFVSMTEPYSYKLISLVKDFTDIHLKEGVYVGVAGPNFETPAEANFMRMIGGDAIGMSTVGETIVARQCGIEVLALSCISNYAAAIRIQRLTREESISLAKEAEGKLVSALLNLIALI